MGGFYKHFGLRVTPRRSIFFVSMPTLGPHNSAKNQSNSKIKVPTDPSSHVLSAKKISDDLEILKFLTSDPWPTPKWAIYIGGGTSRWPIWPKFWLRGFLDQTSWLTKKNWPKCHFSGFSPLIYNWIGASLLVYEACKADLNFWSLDCRVSGLVFMDATKRLGSSQI